MAGGNLHSGVIPHRPKQKGDELHLLAEASQSIPQPSNRSNNWIDEQFEAQRLLNAGFTSLNVITYDQVLRRAKIIMGCNA